MAEQKVLTGRIDLETGEKAKHPKGHVTAVFATLNVRDSDGDVTLPGAFGTQEVRMQPFGHDRGSPSLGKGFIHEEGDKAVFDGQINLAMESGRELYESLRFDMENGDTPLTEFSYTFDIQNAEPGQFEGQPVQFLKSLRVFSVDAVFKGAGVATGLVEVKSLDLPSGMSTSDLQEAYWAAFQKAHPAMFSGEGWGYVEALYDSTGVVRVDKGYLQTPYKLEGQDVVLMGAPQSVVRQTTWVDPDQAKEEALWPPKVPTFTDLATLARKSLQDGQAFITQAGALVATLFGKGETLTEAKREAMTGLCSDVDALQARAGFVLQAATPPVEKQPADPPPSKRGTRMRFAALSEARRELEDVKV